MAVPAAIEWYDENATAVARRYGAVASAPLHEWMADLLPESPSLIIDVGAGSGRDAAWFASRGHRILAVEPSVGMRREGQSLQSAPNIRWIDDSLPGLADVTRSGFVADVVLVNAVWQHVAPGDRRRAFRKLVSILRSGGLLAMTLRQGPAEQERQMYPVSVAEIEQLARMHGMEVVRISHAKDYGGRPGISWTNVTMRLPDDGTGALPLLRHLILDQ